MENNFIAEITIPTKNSLANQNSLSTI